METKMRVLLTVFMICLVAAGNVFGQAGKMYSWTDEDGVVHFTDKPPENREAEVSDIPASSQPVGESPYSQSQIDNVSVAAQQKRDEIARKNQQAEANRTATEAVCAAKRAEVAQLEPHRRIYYTNEQGETERMDDVARTDRVAAAKAFIQANCR
jgi:hypothetical protein